MVGLTTDGNVLVQVALQLAAFAAERTLELGVDPALVLHVAVEIALVVVHLLAPLALERALVLLPF